MVPLRALSALGAVCVAIAAMSLSCDGVLSLDAFRPTATESDSGSDPAAGSGVLRMLITDTPFPFDCLDEALVYISRVEVRRADDEDGDGDDNGDGDTEEGDEDGSPWSVIFTAEGDGKPFDLLDLQNGRTDLLADTVIEAGRYTQTRIIVSRGQATLTDGRVFDLRVPSGSQTGIKLHFTFDVTEGEETVLLLDVDLSRAFQAIPGRGGCDEEGIREIRFTPSVAMKLIALLDAGSITGTVTDGEGDPLSGVTVRALRDDEPEGTAATEEDGSYVLIGLVSANYDVEFSAEGYTTVTLEDLPVEAGQTLEGVDAVLLPDEPEEEE